MPPRKNATSPVESLSNVVALVTDKRQDTLGRMIAVQESTANWLQESIQSYKRKLGQFSDDDAIMKATPATAATLEELNSSNKVKQTVLSSQSSNKRIKSQHKGKIAPVHENNNSNNTDNHPQYLSVMSKKVAELRKELKARGLEASGLKKDLQQRLLQSIIEHDKRAATSGNDDDNDASDHDDIKDDTEEEGNKADNEQQRRPAKSPFSKVEDHEEEEPEEEDQDPVEDDRMSIEPPPPPPKEDTNDRMSVDAPAPLTVAIAVAVAKSATKNKPPPKVFTVQQSFVKSTAALFSPTKLTSKFQQPRQHEVPLSQLQQKPKPTVLSPFASFKKTIAKTASTLLSSSSKIRTTKMMIEDESSTLAQAGGLAATAAIEKLKQDKVNTISSAVTQQSSKPSGSNSGGKSATSMESTLTGGVSSSIKEKQKLLAEARKQRLAEMRGKSKPVAASTGSSNSKLMQSCTKEESKRTAMNNKIREKHAATAAAALKGFQQSASVPTGLGNASKFGSITKQPFGATKTLSSSNILSSSFKSQQAPAKVASNPRSPMDTYEISDREESDSDESDCSHAAPRKNVPGWAQKENLIKALKEQYDDTLPGRYDPDQLFPEVETCDLEAIFDKKRSRYTKRTSSGNWTKDRVTAAEKLTYKRTMGYDKLK